MNPRAGPVRERARRGRTAIALLLVAIGLSLVFGLLDGLTRHYGHGLAQGEPTCGTGTTTVCVLPVSQIADTGATFTAEVVADNVSNLGAYQFTLSFDPGVISFVGATTTSFLGSTGRDVTCSGPWASGGSVSISCVTTSPPSTGPPGPDGPDGSGALVSLEFSGLMPGDSPLTLSDVILADIRGNPIPSTTQDGSVTIVQGATATPCPGGVCPTPTPTLTPTPTATPAVGPTTVRIDPPSQTQPEGATFSVSLLVENVTNLASYQFTLAWDHLALEFLGASNGTFLGSSGRSVFCPSPIVGENTVRMGCVTSGETPPGPDGSGVLAVLSFRAESGTYPATPTALDLFDVELSDPLANGISAVVQDGTVTVEKPTPTPCPGGICPTATPALTPSPTPSPTPYPDPCLSGSGADVCVKPASLNVSAGDGFSVDIVADDVSNLGGYALTLTFDPTVIAYNSVTNGPFLGSSGRPVNCFSPTVLPGSVTYRCLTTGATPPGPSGAGILATVSFTALAEGTTTLSLSLHGTMLADIVGTQIPSTPHAGTITVFPGEVPTPTTTPTTGPTPTATTVPTTLVWIDPPTQTVAPGASPAIDIRIDNVANLGSYEWQITYDPAVLDFVSVVDGPFLASTGRSVFCPDAILDVGSVRFGCVSAGVTPAPPSGSGVLSTVTFSAVAEGTSALSFNFVSLSDPLGVDIPTGIQGGEIVVSTVTPTPTPTIGGGAPAGAPKSGGGWPSALTLTGAVFVSVGFILLASDLLDTIPRRSRRGKWRHASSEPPKRDKLAEADDDI
jgi:hypothetical protein